ncbi:MAG: hypothetical protein IPH82_10570 [Chloroflexi bacterium]|nr:hypothetical protein [Chloroflexota bacterium]
MNQPNNLKQRLLHHRQPGYLDAAAANSFWRSGGREEWQAYLHNEAGEVVGLRTFLQPDARTAVCPGSCCGL